MLEVLVCSGLPTQLLIMQLLALTGWRPFRAGGQLSAPYVFALSMLDAFLLIGLVVVLLRAHGERPSSVLLGTRPVSRELLLGVLLSPLVLILAVVTLLTVQRVAPWMHNVVRNPLEDLIQSPADTWMFLAVAIVAGGLREEIQRAFVLHRFEQRLGGATVGLVLFSLLFGAGHALQGWDAALATGLLGATWGIMYLVRRSIVAAVVSHAAFNVFEILQHGGSGP